MQLTTHILSVTSRVTGGGRTLYDVACGDGVKYTVWEAPLANALQAFAGQPQQAVLDTDSSPSRDGRFTNHTIRALLGNGPVGQPPSAVTPMAPAPGVGYGNPPQAPVTVPFAGNTAPIQPAPPRDNMPPDTVARITKMGCLGYAATLVGALYQGAGPEALAEATEATLKTAQTLYKAARSHEAGQGPVVLQQSAQGALVAPTTPAEVAAQVPGVTVGAPVAAPVAAPDDIPWD